MFRTALTACLVAAVAGTGALAGTAAQPEMTSGEVIATANMEMATIDHMLPAIVFAVVVISAVSLMPVLCPSDRRLKTDITQVGSTVGGLPLYHFRYIGQPQVWEGVMAQDVLAYRPEAVGELGGYLAVNYGMLGIEMRAVN